MNQYDEVGTLTAGGGMLRRRWRGGMGAHPADRIARAASWVYDEDRGAVGPADAPPVAGRRIRGAPRPLLGLLLGAALALGALADPSYAEETASSAAGRDGRSFPTASPPACYERCFRPLASPGRSRFPDGGAGWRFTVAPYLWMVGANGDAFLRGAQRDIDANFFDWADKLTFAAQGYADVRRGRWYAAVDGTYLELGDTRTLGPNQRFTRDYEADLTLLDLRIGYEVWGRRTVHPDAWGRACDVREQALLAFVGARYWRFDQEITLAGPGGAAPLRVDDTQEWVDPFVGLRFSCDVSRHFALDLRADVGGFGIGDGADFTWQTGAYLTWKVNRVFGVVAGYRAIGLDRVRGSGDDRRGFDGVLHGPLVGFKFTF